MRITLDIDDDILQAAKRLALEERSDAGAIISRLARRGLHSEETPGTLIKNGVPVFPARDREVVTPEHVLKIIEEESL